MTSAAALIDWKRQLVYMYIRPTYAIDCLLPRVLYVFRNFGWPHGAPNPAGANFLFQNSHSSTHLSIAAIITKVHLGVSACKVHWAVCLLALVVKIPFL